MRLEILEDYIIDVPSILCFEFTINVVIRNTQKSILEVNSSTSKSNEVEV